MNATSIDIWASDDPSPVGVSGVREVCSFCSRCNGPIFAHQPIARAPHSDERFEYLYCGACQPDAVELPQQATTSNSVEDSTASTDDAASGSDSPSIPGAADSLLAGTAPVGESVAPVNSPWAIVCRSALTIRPPWAGLIGLGLKDVENRSWHTKHRGGIWIHAGKTSDSEGWGMLHAGELPTGRQLTDDDLAVCNVKGAIIAYAEIVSCRPFSIEGSSPWHAQGQFGWYLENVRLLAEPVPCRGAQGLWKVDDEVLGRIRAVGFAAATALR